MRRKMRGREGMTQHGVESERFDDVTDYSQVMSHSIVSGSIFVGCNESGSVLSFQFLHCTHNYTV